MNPAMKLVERCTRRPPDFIIGESPRPYLLRWYLLPKNRWLNVYVHCFLRSDDDRALHDHPWSNISLLLRGCYVEHRIKAGGIAARTLRIAGDITARRPQTAHRIELVNGPCWSLFITGPRVRDWGFHCPQRWIPWQEFTDPTNSGIIGRGCQ